MIITFDEVSFRNFMSYGNNLTIFNLINPGTNLITGKNGDGKTTILNAITYALYDKPAYDDIPKDGLINWFNKKDMEVNISFSVDSIKYRIKRERKSKNGNNVYLWIDGVDKTLDSVAANNTKIEEILGIKYDLFVRVIMYCASQTAFLELTRTEQANMFERLVGLTLLSEKAATLKDNIKETETKLQIKQAKIQILQDEQKRHDNQILHAQERVEKWNITNNTEIDNLLQQKERLHTIDFIAEQQAYQELAILVKQIQQNNALLLQYTTNFKNIDNDEKKFEKLKDIDFNQEQQLHEELLDLDKQLATAMVNYTKYTTAMVEINKHLKEDNNELVHLKDNKCPYCLQQYLDANIKIAELEDSVTNLEQFFKKTNKALIKATDNKQTIETARLDIQKRLHTSGLGQVLTLKTEYDNLSLKIAEFNNKKQEMEELTATTTKLNQQVSDVKLNLITEDLDELNNLKTTFDNITNRLNIAYTAINPHVEALTELLNTKLGKIDHTEINELDKTITHQKFLLKLLTKKDSFVRKALLNKYIPYINTKLQYYLTELDLPHKVKFTHEMAADITQYGKILGFGNLSRGQKARVNIALSFAFSDILQELHGIFNIFMLDEVLDVGLDSEGLELAIKLLKNRARERDVSMYIISHRQEAVGVFDNTINIYTDKQFSYIA